MVECVNCAKFKGCDLSSPNVNECADYTEKLTNEEWLNGLPTTEKSEFMAKMVTDAIKEHGEHGVTRCEAVIWWDEWLKQPHKE